MKKFLGFLLALIVLVAVLVGAGAYYLNTPAGGGATTLEVKPGTGLRDIANELEERKVVRSAEALLAALRYRGSAGRIREGLYDLDGQRTTLEVARALEAGGRPRLVRFVIPEGKRMDEIAQIIAGAGLSSEAELRRAFADASLNPHARGNLEGFLFPATYEVSPESSARAIAQILTNRMNEELTPERLAAARKLGLDAYAWVTLASVVQSEAGSDAEMAPIAGIFLNRLDIGMRLQSDPTIAYGLGKRLPELDRRAGDFTKDTPYNTYTRAGLPKGPIGNPGEAALLSVLEARRDINGKRALYFVHGIDGRLHINADFLEHQRDVARYR
ncbi:UPF0755 protein [Deinobacterium chartae]|uniref:Endolytic murein transglycosylase n=1 Tax=Deinobacterium chartae TaxID=521158 RepID=A0A841I0V8_9DEIO|nr:endolytic transglycosylase MltG [Deinobacterium chartae]MBB6099421.1 UPF0755 protein [Deinobacterium chartae]